MSIVYKYILKIIPVMYILYLFSLLCSMAGMELFSWGTFILILFVGAYEYYKDKKIIFVSSPLNKYIGLEFDRINV